MKGFLLNLCNIISSLSVVDLLLLGTLVILIILVISLIYILKGSSYVEVTNKEEVPVIEEVKVEDAKKEEPLDLPTLTKILENAPKKNIELTPYEEEQEEKAIISYDELVKVKSNLMINYEDEKEEDGVLVKKIDLANLTTVIEDTEGVDNITADSRPNVTISYEREEAFLQALKQLQQMLNS